MDGSKILDDCLIDTRGKVAMKVAMHLERAMVLAKSDSNYDHVLLCSCVAMVTAMSMDVAQRGCCLGTHRVSSKARAKASVMFC